MELGIGVPPQAYKGKNGCVVDWAHFVGTGLFQAPGIMGRTVYPEIDPISPLEKAARGDSSHPLYDADLTGFLWDG